MVHPLAGPQLRAEMDAQQDGLPALVIEVASPSTWRTDVATDPTRPGGAKAYEYLALGVAEYLVFDPGGEYLQGQVRAWRLVQGHRTSWQPDREGRYHSRELGIAVIPEELFLRIIDRNGQPVPFDHEMDQRIQTEIAHRQETEARAAQEAARADEEARQRQEAEAEIARLRAELDRRYREGNNGASS